MRDRLGGGGTARQWRDGGGGRCDRASRSQASRRRRASRASSRVWRPTGGPPPARTAGPGYCELPFGLPAWTAVLRRGRFGASRGTGFDGLAMVRILHSSARVRRACAASHRDARRAPTARCTLPSPAHVTEVPARRKFSVRASLITRRATAGTPALPDRAPPASPSRTRARSSRPGR